MEVAPSYKLLYVSVPIWRITFTFSIYMNVTHNSTFNYVTGNKTFQWHCLSGAPTVGRQYRKYQSSLQASEQVRIVNHDHDEGDQIMMTASISVCPGGVRSFPWTTFEWQKDNEHHPSDGSLSLWTLRRSVRRILKRHQRCSSTAGQE